jgi:hypothetical protein
VFVILPFSRSFHLKIPFFETKSGGIPFHICFISRHPNGHTFFLYPPHPSPAQPPFVMSALYGPRNATVSNYLLIFFGESQKEKITFQGVANRSNCLSTFPV